jgi:hypothetical protein
MGKWAEALRSDVYEQTDGVMYDGLGYCCLGVRSVLEGVKFTKSEIEEDAWMDDEGAVGLPHHSKLEAWNLTEEITTEEEARLLREIPQINDFLIMHRKRLGAPVFRYNVLAIMNDNDVSFPVIANVIEQFGWDNSE